MTAMYRVTFDKPVASLGATSIVVHSADAKSMKRKDLTAALVRARKKAEARVDAKRIGARATKIDCIG